MKDTESKVILQLTDQKSKTTYRLVGNRICGNINIVLEFLAKDALNNECWRRRDSHDRFLELIVEYCLSNKLQLIMKE